MNNTILMALIATLGTWFITALGAATVIFFKKTSDKVMNLMLGFAGDDCRKFLVAASTGDREGGNISVRPGMACCLVWIYFRRAFYVGIRQSGHLCRAA